MIVNSTASDWILCRSGDVVGCIDLSTLVTWFTRARVFARAMISIFALCAIEAPRNSR